MQKQRAVLLVTLDAVDVDKFSLSVLFCPHIFADKVCIFIYMIERQAVVAQWKNGLSNENSTVWIFVAAWL